MEVIALGALGREGGRVDVGVFLADDQFDRWPLLRNEPSHGDRLVQHEGQGHLGTFHHAHASCVGNLFVSQFGVGRIDDSGIGTRQGGMLDDLDAVVARTALGELDMIDHVGGDFRNDAAEHRIVQVLCEANPNRLLRIFAIDQSRGTGQQIVEAGHDHHRCTQLDRGVPRADGHGIVAFGEDAPLDGRQQGEGRQQLGQDDAEHHQRGESAQIRPHQGPGGDALYPVMGGGMDDGFSNQSLL